MFVATCMAGMTTMTTLNNHPEVIKLRPTTTTTTTIIPPTDFAMLFLCSRIWFESKIWHKKTSCSETLTKSKTPRLIDSTGELSTTFDLDGQEVYMSCGVTFQNKQYIFGGDKNKRQVLQIDDCGLNKLGLIPFDHRSGACGSTSGVIVLCFHTDSDRDFSNGAYKSCRQSSSPSDSWTQMAPSTYAHRDTSIATSPGNQWLMVIILIDIRWVSGSRILLSKQQ